MRRRTLLTSALLGLPTLGLARNLAAADSKTLPPLALPKLTVSIAIPGREGKRSLNQYDHFHVLVTNHSPDNLNLWTDRFSWGYDNLSFEMVDEAGQTTRITKKPHDWLKNFPDWLTLTSGESFVINVDLFSAQAGSIWDRLPVKANRPQHVQLKAIYEIQPTPESGVHNVWTGRLESRQNGYTIW